jgi:hypothetical protein
VTPEVDRFIEVLDLTIAATPQEDLPALITVLSAKAAAAAARILSAPRVGDVDHKGPDGNVPVHDAARRLGVSPDWLYKNAHRLPFALRIGRRLLFSARGLERWNAQRQGR